jgi:hypothetical protein
MSIKNLFNKKKNDSFLKSQIYRMSKKIELKNKQNNNKNLQ